MHAPAVLEATVRVHSDNRIPWLLVIEPYRYGRKDLETVQMPQLASRL
jgi:hypothetical protein